MRLAKLSEFATSYFDASSRPSPPTLRAMAERGDLPVRRIGRLWYVDLDRFEGDDDPDVLLKKIMQS